MSLRADETAAPEQAKSEQGEHEAAAPEKEAATTEGAKAEAAADEKKAEGASAETAAPEPLTPEQMFEGGATPLNNYVEFSAGGLITHGNKAAFQQRQQNPTGAFGGLENFHYQAQIATNTVLTLDGRAIFDTDDYKFRLDVTREKVGYVRFSYNEFRTWYNGGGGYDPLSNTYYPWREDALALDRSEIIFETGLRLEDKPAITFRYRHGVRDGEKSSTIWGIAHPSGLPLGISPSFYDINERNDSFELDLTHTLGTTDFGVGLRYDNGKIDDTLNINQSPGEPAFQRKITDRQGTTYDMFNVHAFTETWITNNLMFSTGYSYTDLNTDFTGSRIYGSDFDVSYAPNALNGFGYNGLTGGSRLHEYVGDLNLFYQPIPTLSIIPSLRVQKEDANADSDGMETLATQQVTDFSSWSRRELLDVRERLDIRYTGITNWVLYARADFTEGDGNLREFGGLVPVNGIGVPAIDRKTEDERFFQKYSAGARWYPAKAVTVDAGGYYKLNTYDYDHSLDSTPNDSFNRYPAYLVMQDFETYDGNFRLTLRPWKSVTLGSRYEYQYSTIHTQPDSISGLDGVDASTMRTHILAEDIGWAPWTRLYLQAGFSYVLSETRTPASDITEAILRAQNNYWTVNFSSSLVLDNKTDLKLSYFYYQADNLPDDPKLSVLYAADSHEHGVTATLIRRISSNIRWTLRYGFFMNRDDLYAGNNNYDAHLLFSTIQYRF